MVYTLTLNPALDYYLELDAFHLGETNRSKSETLVAGGKGINVSMMLNNLGVSNQALGFLAGFSGEEISRRLQRANINSRFVFLKNGYSRINVKILSEEESEINANGAIPTQDEIEMLLHLLEGVSQDDMLILSGSLAQGMPKNFYAQIMKQCSHTPIILDTIGEALTLALPYAPLLIKPNKAELEGIFHHKIYSLDEILIDCKKLQEMGARNVLVSLGGDGAVFVGENAEVYSLSVPKGELINSVGAGDSMVAGFCMGYLRSQDVKEAFYYALASGSASAYSEGFGSLQKVEELFYQMKEEE
ncbi:1-phosphofructokinase [Helicobacter cholecystus]|uniref:1-phosphofructokinase n=1 Tax=Helicobacter cholecystus TaxID=45498 RepID=UPI002739EC5D|nr:1-phosphofructokinase [Helicobacter cholecystus]